MREIPNKRAKLLAVIKDRGSIGYNELKKVICDEIGLVSVRPFRVLLKELVDAKVVIRTPQKDSQRVLYSINDKEFEASSIEERLKERNAVLRKRLDQIKQLYHKMTAPEQSNIICEFLPLLDLAKSEATMTNRFYPNEVIRNEVMVLEDLHEEFLKMILSRSQDLPSTLHVVYYINDTKIFPLTKDLDSLINLYKIAYGEKK